MAITVLDTAASMEEIFRSPLDERPRLLRQMLAPTLGMYRYFPGEVDLVALHHMSDGFRVDREDERPPPALAALTEADAWRRVEVAATLALAHQLAATPGAAVPDQVLASRDDVLRRALD